MPPEPLRVLLVDDEPLARRALRADCARLDDVEVVGEAEDGERAVLAIETLRPDLVLLDVQMPSLDGFEVLAQLAPEARPAVVFVTAFDAYALRAFDVHAVDYLTKPFDFARLREAIARARHRLATSATGRDALLDDTPPRRVDRFVVRHAGRMRTVEVEEIEWIEARDNYVQLHGEGGPFLLRHTLGALERSLANAGFVRVHRSALVRIAAVVDWKRTESSDFVVRMRSGAEVAMSRGHREAFEGAMRSAT